MNQKVCDGPFPVEETRFGFIWGSVHVERIGVERGEAGIYISDGNGHGIEVHVPLNGKGPVEAVKWPEPKRPWYCRLKGWALCRTDRNGYCKHGHFHGIEVGA